VRRPGHLDELVRQLQTTIGPKLALVTGLKKGAGKEAAAVLAETLGLFAGTADAALEAISILDAGQFKSKISAMPDVIIPEGTGPNNASDLQWAARKACTFAVRCAEGLKTL
jgi:hypothetical protein